MQHKAAFRCQKFRSSTDNISKFEFLMPVPGRIGLFQIYIMVSVRKLNRYSCNFFLLMYIGSYFHCHTLPIINSFVQIVILYGDSIIFQSWGSQTYTESYSITPPDAGWGTPSPDIHFRHSKQVVICWLDGHVDVEKYSYSNGNDYAERRIGWFGDKADGNRYFDRE